jgi:hypothetical protein
MGDDVWRKGERARERQEKRQETLVSLYAPRRQGFELPSKVSFS